MTTKEIIESIDYDARALARGVDGDCRQRIARSLQLDAADLRERHAELLAALKDFLRAEESASQGFGPNQIAHLERAIDGARAAIAKAEGGQG